MRYGLSMETRLDELLEANRNFDSLYDDALSNHLSMALIALRAMGADDATLEAFFENYSKRLEPSLGRAAERDVGEALSKLSLGVGASAFHGLIQTAYAIEHGHALDIACALEVWERSYLPLGRSTSFVDAFDFELPKLSNIFLRMKHIAGLSAFRRQLSEGGDVDDSALIDFSVRGYFATKGDFTALHLVTAVDAFLLIEERYAMDRPALVAALSAALLTIQKPLTSDEAPPATRSWDDLRREAAASPNDHTIKLAYSCERMAKRSGDDRYRSIVEHRLQRAV
ncbi:MAG: hypothetical protein ACI9KE_004393 [Polyangiales bacterium]|jgi:hypothetical protein